MSEKHVIKYSQVSNAAEAFSELKEKLHEDLLAEYKVRPEIQFHEKKNKVEAKGKGFTFILHCYEKKVEYALDLSFILRPFKSKIVKILNEELNKIL